MENTTKISRKERKAKNVLNGFQNAKKDMIECFNQTKSSRFGLFLAESPPFTPKNPLCRFPRILPQNSAKITCFFLSYGVK